MADNNIPGAEMPKFRNLWEHIGKRMPRKGRAKSAVRLRDRDLSRSLIHGETSVNV